MEQPKSHLPPPFIGSYARQDASEQTNLHGCSDDILSRVHHWSIQLGTGDYRCSHSPHFDAQEQAAFWWTLAGLISLVVMHGVYWTITHTTNKFWMKNQQVNKAGAKFFSSDPMKRGEVVEKDVDNWKRFQDRWEYSHVVRAILDVVALIALTVAAAARPATVWRVLADVEHWRDWTPTVVEIKPLSSCGLTV